MQVLKLPMTFPAPYAGLAGMARTVAENRNFKPLVFEAFVCTLAMM